MRKLISDYAQVEISNKVKDILRMYYNSTWHSEPYHQNQNPSEWYYRTIKAWTNTILNMTGAPATCWLLCISYVCYLLNHISCESMKLSLDLMVSHLILAFSWCTPSISLYIMHPITNISSRLVKKNMPFGLVLVGM